MSADRSFWPMAREYEYDDEDLVLRCEPCEGTGSVGCIEEACSCRACGGRGGLPLPTSLVVEAGHA